MLSKEQRSNGKKINSWILRGRYKEAIALAKKELKRLPLNDWDAHWLYTQLSAAYYEQRKYKTALKYSSKAYDIAPWCPLSIWHYAGDLYDNKKFSIAADLYHSMLEKSTNELAFGVCGEGREMASTYKSDCRIRLAMCYFKMKELQKARHWARLFLRYYPKSKLGIYRKEFGKKWFREIEKEIANENRKEANR
jgi:tetratricopeptide (TPR) repeat protein